MTYNNWARALETPCNILGAEGKGDEGRWPRIKAEGRGTQIPPKIICGISLVFKYLWPKKKKITWQISRISQWFRKTYWERRSEATRAYVYEGNHRMAVLLNEDVPWVPLKINYFFLKNDHDRNLISYHA